MSLPLTRESFVNARGERFSLLHGRPADPAPLLHWTHATGFNAGTYREMLAELAHGLDVRALDMRGHGLSEAAAEPATLDSWDIYRADLVELVDSLHAPVCLAGHSMGGTTSVAVAACQPERVSALVLVEPVLLDAAAGEAFAAAKRSGTSNTVGLARSARKRRSTFPSREAAVENYAGRGAFASWQRAWIEAYVEGGTRPTPDGAVELSCSPAWESATFAATEHDPWPDVARIRCPVTLVVGTRDSTCGRPSVQRFLELQPSTRLVEVDGASHFLPMEQPELVIREILARAAPAS